MGSDAKNEKGRRGSGASHFPRQVTKNSLFYIRFGIRFMSVGWKSFSSSNLDLSQAQASIRKSPFFFCRGWKRRKEERKKRKWGIYLGNIWEDVARDAPPPPPPFPCDGPRFVTRGGLQRRTRGAQFLPSRMHAMPVNKTRKSNGINSKSGSMITRGETGKGKGKEEEPTPDFAAPQSFLFFLFLWGNVRKNPFSWHGAASPPLCRW